MMADLTGQLFGNYRLVRLLGQGGFAEVYLAEHIHLGSQVAIKVLQARLVGNAMEQFRNEGRSIASLLHPNIVRVFDFGIQDGTPFLVMDYAPNGTMRQRYPKGSVLSPTRILSPLKQMALALQYAHDSKLIHRDIKPENMLLGSQDEILLSDFGLVLPVQSSKSQTTKELAGTLPYMAPEQINGKPRPASDQYALGVVVYEWLSGKCPFEGTFIEIATQHMMTTPEPLYGKVAEVSPAMQEVLFVALAKEPQQRFATIQAFAAAFESACQLNGIAPLTFPAKGSRLSPSSLNDASSIPTNFKTLSSPDTASTHTSSTPTYIKTPLPNNPQQPAIMLPHVPVQSGQPARSAIRAGEISENWPAEQPTSLLVNTTLPVPIISGRIVQHKKGRASLLILVCILIITLMGSSLAYAALNGISGPGRSGTGTPTALANAQASATSQATSTALANAQASATSQATSTALANAQASATPHANTSVTASAQTQAPANATVATAAATPSLQTPTSVMLRVSAPGISPTTEGNVTVPSGTVVTLTVIPDHSLLPFQTFTMGIYATDPYPFSELQDCTYPNTDTCSYRVAYSSSENTDYTKGKHTFRAFLGHIGGAITKNSSDVTISWS